MSEQRFIELEIKVAYQEDLVQDLNQIVIKQQRQLDRLEATCKMLHERIKNLQDTAHEEDVDQTPPHY
ncbi:MAG: SlyX family protein [Methylococcaceae bacterium]|nr:SlyX family protein [Methylococcaceae bacterium]